MNESPPEASQTAVGSVWSRMFNVLATPGDAFEEVRTGPPCQANWLLPALLVMVIGWIGAWLIFSQDSVKQQMQELQEKAIQQQVDKGKMTAEQAKQALAAAEKFAGIAQKVGAMLTPVLSAIIGPFWWGLLLWLGGSLVFKRPVPFMKAVEVAGLSNMVGVIEAVVKTLLIITFGSVFAGPNLALFVKEFDPQNPLHGVLAVVDVMTLWILVVRSIGLARVGGVALGKSALWVFGTWAVLTGGLMAVGFAVQKAFGG